MVIQDAVIISKEVRSGAVFGSVRLYNVDDPTKPESSAQHILALTYPTQALRQALSAVAQRLSGERAQGTFIFAGDYGTGKSHTLLALYHILHSPAEGREWLNRRGIDLSFPERVDVVTSHLLDEDPEFVWEPLFRKCGREDVLGQVLDHPTGAQLQALLSERPLVFVLDELEAWYGSIEDKTRRERNLNFLQVFTEATEDARVKLLLLASLYGRDAELLGRLGRGKIFLKDLGAGEDKAQVVRFRLFEEIDEEAAQRTVDDYIGLYAQHRAQVGLTDTSLDACRERMLAYYPLHPELVDVLFQTYSASREYQNTRGVLFLLSGVLRRFASERDLLLPADVDPNVGEVNDDLFQLNPRLLARAQEDIARTRQEPLSRDILATILLRSFVPEMAGAEATQIALGCLRPGVNPNEITRVLDRLEDAAWYLWRSDGRYVIRSEENLPVSINARAARQLKEQGPTQARVRLAGMIGQIAGGTNTFVYPIEEVPRQRAMRVMVSTQYLDDEPLREFYHGREWRNTLLVVRPKVAGDLAATERFLLSAQRLLVCQQLKRDLAAAKEKDKLAQLKEYVEREEGDLKTKLAANYGEWMKPGMRGGKLYFRPIDCSLDAQEVLRLARESFGAEVVDDAILAELRNAGENGVRFDRLRQAFLMVPGKPILVNSEVLRERVLALCNQQGEVVMVRGKNVYGPENRAPRDFAEDVLLYLKAHGPAVVGVEQLEKAGIEYAVPEPERKAVPGEGAAEKAETGEPPPPGRCIVVKSDRHRTPFNLQTDVEGRLRRDDRVRAIEIEVDGGGLQEAGPLSHLLERLHTSGGETQVMLRLRVALPTPVGKQEVLKILDQLPIPVEGTIAATLEVLADE